MVYKYKLKTYVKFIDQTKKSCYKIFTSCLWQHEAFETTYIYNYKAD